MCSSGGSVATEDKALQAAQTAQVNTLNADYSTSFAEQQQVLKAQQARLSQMVSNPLGYSPAELHAATTSINEQTSTAAKQALGSAAAFAAAHGSSDIGGGSIGQIAGQIGSAAAGEKARELSSLSQANESMKRESMFKGLEGLNQVGAEFGGAGGTAAGASSSTAGSATNAGAGVLAAQDAGWSHLTGVLSGISGIAQAGATAYAGR